MSRQCRVTGDALRLPRAPQGLPPISGGSLDGVLECRVEQASFATIVHPAGEVDLATVPILRNALATAVSPDRHIIVDLSDVTYIDSSGFRELLARRRLCRENDRLMVLVNPRPTVQKLIDSLNFYQILPVFASIEAARASLSGPARPAGR